MTRYLCTDPSHLRDGTLRPVDVTAQVRLERELLPRPLVYLASTEAVVKAVARLGDRDDGDRRGAIRGILTGASEPLDVPVVLAAERAVLFHPAGLHELDDLRRAEPAIERLLEDAPVPAAPEDVVILSEDGVDRPIPPAATAPIATRTPPRVDTVPQGVFDLGELSERLATTDADTAALLDAIRSTPRVTAAATATGDPWRVVVTCPRPEGEPPVHHDVVFVGTGALEARFVQGTKPDRTDEVLERDAASLAPAGELAQTERRLAGLLVAEAVIALVIVAFAWISGGLAAAARETPVWLALAIGFLLASWAFGGLALLAPRDPAGNVNDTYQVRRFYSSRMQLLHLAMAVSAAGFALALLFGLVPPAVALSTVPRPAATVRFSDARDVATVSVHIDGIGADSEVVVRMEEFTTSSSSGSTVGLVTATGDASGVVETVQDVAIAGNAGFLAVLVTPEGDATATCTPLAAVGPGCTVVALPTGVGGTIQPVVVTSPAPTTPIGSATPTPSAGASPTLPTPSG
jgi:hypothetical protein